ncbi:MAG: HpcH/HpaI aldolase/citrate lyase family protein [Actinomycetota bacterium]|nr:HpcH/HpaI aldolase/citrate lyase family protein [Actinomycetota bacterium]
MRHFSFLGEEQISRLFHLRPQTISGDSSPELLAAALGGTLYSPADRPQLAHDIAKQAARGCLSMVLCLEDSIADSAVDAAETNVVQTLEYFYEQDAPADGTSEGDIPMLFVRVRSPEQMLRIAQRCGQALDVLTGFVIPKFENRTGMAQRFLDALHCIHELHGQAGSSGRRRLRIMPILESRVMIHAETRAGVLAEILAVLQTNREDILAVRVGATDLSSAFGLRRSRDLTIYDVKVVASIIADIVNVLGRSSDGFVISGPVWEHYANTERLLRPMLRATPFATTESSELRHRILMANLDGLMREIGLDQANGLLGKTVIHPSHVPLVHAMSVVSHEEYVDAQEILGNSQGGAAASPYGNKMNEMKPHQAWAAKTMLRAAAFGAAAVDVTYVELLEASMS